MKYFFLGIGIALFLGAGYWVVVYSHWFDGTNVPQNLPTAEEKARMKAVEESSSQIAPNAKPGAGVRPVGSLPTNPEPALEGTTTESTTTASTSTGN